MLIRFFDWLIRQWRSLTGRSEHWPLDAETMKALGKLDPDDIDPTVIAGAMKVSVKHAKWLCETAVRQGLFGCRYYLIKRDAE